MKSDLRKSEKKKGKKKPTKLQPPGKRQSLRNSGQTPVARGGGLTPLRLPRARQSDSRPGQTFLLIHTITTRASPPPLLLTTPPCAFHCPSLLTTSRVLDYSDDIVFLSQLAHFLYQLPAPLPDNCIIIAISRSVWIVLLM